MSGRLTPGPAPSVGSTPSVSGLAGPHGRRAERPLKIGHPCHGPDCRPQPQPRPAGLPVHRVRGGTAAWNAGPPLCLACVQPPTHPRKVQGQKGPNRAAIPETWAVVELTQTQTQIRAETPKSKTAPQVSQPVPESRFLVLALLPAMDSPLCSLPMPMPLCVPPRPPGSGWLKRVNVPCVAPVAGRGTKRGLGMHGIQGGRAARGG